MTNHEAGVRLIVAASLMLIAFISIIARDRKSEDTPSLFLLLSGVSFGQVLIVAITLLNK